MARCALLDANLTLAAYESSAPALRRIREVYVQETRRGSKGLRAARSPMMARMKHQLELLHCMVVVDVFLLLTRLGDVL